MNGDPDFEIKLNPQKMLREYQVRKILTDVDMRAYFIVLARSWEPREIWKIVPEQLKEPLTSLVREAMRLGSGKKPIVGGPFEGYWAHTAALRWDEFFKQLKSDERIPN